MEYAAFVQNLDKVSPNGDRCPPESPYSREFERRMGALVLNFDLDGNPATTTAVAAENDGLSGEEYDADSGVGSFDESKDDRDDQSSPESGSSRLKKLVSTAGNQPDQSGTSSVVMSWSASTGEEEPNHIVAPFRTNGSFPAESRANTRSNSNGLAHPHKRRHGRSDDRETDMDSKDALMAKLRKRSSSPATAWSTERIERSQWSDSE